MPVNPLLGRWREEGQKAEANVDYMRLYLLKIRTKTRHTGTIHILS